MLEVSVAKAKPKIPEPEVPAYSEALEAVIAKVQVYLYLPDPAPLVLVLGAVAAERIGGTPVWLMLVGPPGSGKTAILSSVLELPGVYFTSTLTEAGLLSGTPKREKSKNATGGLLRKINSHGIIVMKDFTSVLAMARESRGVTLAALREVYDGQWTRSIGVDGGQELSWNGRIGFLSGVTEAIDTHHSVISALGDRFVYYRMPEPDNKNITDKITDRDHQIDDVIKEVQWNVFEFFEFLDSSGEVLSASDKTWLGNAAVLVSIARSSVERDSYKRDITHIYRPESPGRITGILYQLFLGLMSIGCSLPETRRLIRTVAIDCIPGERSRLIKQLSIRSPLTINEMCGNNSVKMTETTIRRALEELECYYVVVRNGTQGRQDLWELGPNFRRHWEILHEQL